MSGYTFVVEMSERYLGLPFNFSNSSKRKSMTLFNFRALPTSQPIVSNRTVVTGNLSKIVNVMLLF